MAMNAGFAKFLASKKAAKVGGAPVAPASTGMPMVPMHPQMVSAIKASPKGVLPPGLAKFLAAKKAAKKGGK